MNESYARDELLTEEQTSGDLQVPTGTLANWRCARTKGPPFIKVGRLVRYRRSDIDSWLTAHTVSPTVKGAS